MLFTSCTTDYLKFLLLYFLLKKKKINFTGRLKYLTLTEANRVWMPDLFFSNEKEGHFHNIIMPNVYIRIFPYGSVLYSIRISLTLACPMNLKLYPLDRQVCSLRMASCELNLMFHFEFQMTNKNFPVLISTLIKMAGQRQI